MQDQLTVKTTYGIIRGEEERGVCVWRGIPYAQAPMGALRFLHSRPPQPWTGVRETVCFGKTAPQKERRAEEYSEDCLFLNIWSPAADGKKRPVLFYIHGGSFAAGAGSDPEYNGVNLVHAGDCVVVTVNYRLGVLGFLDFSELGEEFEANCGLSDILSALAWCHDNIARFGGDPENITVFGQSAGAICISALITMKSAQPYIAKAIMMSSGPTLFVNHEEAVQLARQFMEYSGLRTKEALMTAPAELLVEKQKTFTSYCGLGSGTFTIEIDGKLVEKFPIPAVKNGIDKKIPILMGTTREEMSFLFIKPVAKALEIDGIMNAGVSKEPEEIRTGIPPLYDRYGKRGRSMMMADLVFRLASAWFAESASPHTKTWMYSFDYETPAMRVSGLHAFHSSDIPFVFGNFKAGMAKLIFLFSPSKKGPREISRQMQQDFIRFAKTGELPWQPCRGADTPAKCYNKKITYRQIIESDIKEAYLRSEFRRRSFEEEC